MKSPRQAGRQGHFSGFVASWQPCLLPSKGVEASDFLGLDYKDYENLSNLFPSKRWSFAGWKTCCQQEHSSGMTLSLSGCVPVSSEWMKNAVKKKFGKSL